MTEHHLGYPSYGYMESLRPSKKRRVGTGWYAVSGIAFLVFAFAGLTLAYLEWF